MVIRFAQRLLARPLFTFAASQQPTQNTPNDFSPYGRTYRSNGAFDHHLCHTVALTATRPMATEYQI